MRKKSAHEKNANIAELELDVHSIHKSYIICQYRVPVTYLDVGNPTSYGSGSDLSYLGIYEVYICFKILVVKIFRARTLSSHCVPTHQSIDGSAQVSHLSKGKRTILPH